MKALEFREVAFSRDGRSILEGISTDIEQGDFVSVTGPSGSGKSTFLKLCCHLAGPTMGEILYKGRNMLEYDPIVLRKSIAYCFQTPYLFGDTVEENIAFPFVVRSLKIDIERVSRLFTRLRLDKGFIKSQVKNLSGGEKQRIALIRALLFKPEVLLLDEATSALDVENTLVVESVINDLNSEGVTVIWITHDPEQSRRYANKVIVIEGGRIKSAVSAEAKCKEKAMPERTGGEAST